MSQGLVQKKQNQAQLKPQPTQIHDVQYRSLCVFLLVQNWTKKMKSRFHASLPAYIWLNTGTSF